MRPPPVGARVSLRYRLPAGSVPPLTDVVGHVIETGSQILIRTRRNEDVVVAAPDVVAVRIIPEIPVRTSQIRNLEHAAALAWPGAEHQVHAGWLLRSGHGSTRRANSAVPIEFSATPPLSAIIDWYGTRGLPPLLAAPDRLVRVPEGVPVDGENIVLVGEVLTSDPSPDVAITSLPDAAWRDVDQRGVPDDVLTAVIDGEVAFARQADVAVARGAVTTAPDGTRWLGLSAVHVTPGARRNGAGRAICEALLAWGADRSATGVYVQVLPDNAAALALYEAMGLRPHHRSRYVDARNL
ncbi:GNAT family N-acetyltransferase [Mycolicibacterium sp. 624]|uniref:N-acetylglutamate synthase, CG3035 family n=1 Tax=Mycolicibacterium sp. 624 TaxID=3156314 RepID=UPI00339217E1